MLDDIVLIEANLSMRLGHYAFFKVYALYLVKFLIWGMQNNPLEPFLAVRGSLWPFRFYWYLRFIYEDTVKWAPDSWAEKSRRVRWDQWRIFLFETSWWLPHSNVLHTYRHQCSHLSCPSPLTVFSPSAVLPCLFNSFFL